MHQPAMITDLALMLGSISTYHDYAGYLLNLVLVTHPKEYCIWQALARLQQGQPCWLQCRATFLQPLHSSALHWRMGPEPDTSAL